MKIKIKRVKHDFCTHDDSDDCDLCCLRNQSACDVHKCSTREYFVLAEEYEFEELKDQDGN